MTAQNYANFFENIDEHTTIDEFRNYFDEKAYFKDPFHEVVGIDSIYEIFQKMYHNLYNPKFEIDEVIVNKTTAYIKWDFIFCFKNEKEIQRFSGVSRIVFNKEKKVISHEDFWDAAENIYEKIPLLKYFIKLVKNKIRD